MVRAQLRKHTRLVFYSMAVIMLLFSGGCSSLKVVESWHKPAVEGRHYQKVMILGIARDEGKRSTFENLVADELSKHHVVAVPGEVPALRAARFRLGQQQPVLPGCHGRYLELRPEHARPVAVHSLPGVSLPLHIVDKQIRRLHLR